MVNDSFSRLFRSIQRNKLISGLILAVLGMMFLLSPFTSMVTVCVLLGWCILIGGIVQILSTIQGSSGAWVQNIYFYTGIFFVLLGIFVIRKPYTLLDWINLVFGVIVLVSGAYSLIHEQYMRRYIDSRNAMIVILSVIGIVMGVIILLNPFGTIALLSRIIGIALLYEAFVDIRIVSYMKNFRELI